MGERNVTLANGDVVQVKCLSCAIASGLVKPTGGVIYEDEYFHAHQDVAYPIPGLVILASRVRDTAWREDASNSKVRTGAAPRVLASFRKAVLGMLAIKHERKVTENLRRMAWDPARAIALVTEAP